MAPGSSKRARRSPEYGAEEWRLATLVHSAIAGVSLAATVELTSSRDPSSWLLAASVLFALALPSSVASVVMLRYFQARSPAQPGESVPEHPFWSAISSLLAFTAQLAGFGGVLMLFWHLNRAAGVTFTATSLIAIISLAALGRKRTRGPSPQ